MQVSGCWMDQWQTAWRRRHSTKSLTWMPSTAAGDDVHMFERTHGQNDRAHGLWHTAARWSYRVVQAGLLMPLTFARHRLSPSAAFTSRAYFLHNGWRWQWICKFYTVNSKDIFGGPSSECVWQQAITCCLCYRMPQNTFFPQTRNLLVSQKMMQGPFFSPSIPFPW